MRLGGHRCVSESPRRSRAQASSQAYAPSHGGPGSPVTVTPRSPQNNRPSHVRVRKLLLRPENHYLKARCQAETETWRGRQAEAPGAATGREGDVRAAGGRQASPPVRMAKHSDAASRARGRFSAQGPPGGSPGCVLGPSAKSVGARGGSAPGQGSHSGPAAPAPPESGPSHCFLCYRRPSPSPSPSPSVILPLSFSLSLAITSVSDPGSGSADASRGTAVAILSLWARFRTS